MINEIKRDKPKMLAAFEAGEGQEYISTQMESMNKDPLLDEDLAEEYNNSLKDEAEAFMTEDHYYIGVDFAVGYE